MLKGIQARIREVGGAVELRRLEYRNLRPLFVGAEVRVCLRERVGRKEGRGETWDVWAEGPDGGLAVKGTASLEHRTGA
jgi:hydroxyacyl-ACP dehydratase HTD2-like protein with hotdog domain